MFSHVLQLELELISFLYHRRRFVCIKTLVRDMDNTSPSTSASNAHTVRRTEGGFGETKSFVKHLHSLYGPVFPNRYFYKCNFSFTGSHRKEMFYEGTRRCHFDSKRYIS